MYGRGVQKCTDAQMPDWEGFEERQGPSAKLCGDGTSVPPSFRQRSQDPGTFCAHALNLLMLSLLTSQTCASIRVS